MHSIAEYLKNVDPFQSALALPPRLSVEIGVTAVDVEVQIAVVHRTRLGSAGAYVYFGSFYLDSGDHLSEAIVEVEGGVAPFRIAHKPIDDCQDSECVKEQNHADLKEDRQVHM